MYNPGFEYNVATQVPAGWSTTASGSSADADYTQYYGYASLFQLVHQRATAYQVRTYQLLPAVPNGTYTLRAWVQSSGGQSVCQLYANGFGGPEQSVDILGTNGSWARVAVNNIRVTNGQCEIGLRSDAHANETCSLDDVELVPAQVTATAQPDGANTIGAQVFPNPAGRQCTVSYTLARAETVRLSLQNLTGQHVLDLPEQRQAAGPHTEAMELGNGLAPGLYLLEISHVGQLIRQKFIKY